MPNHADVAQAIWQTYAVETGQSLPEGLADKLAAAALGATYLTEELARIHNVEMVEIKPARASAKRGTRLSPDFLPAPRDRMALMQEFPHIEREEWVRVHKMFIDYWTAVPGQKGCKLDWDATWRNWMRKEFSQSQYRRRVPNSAAPGVSKVDRKAASYLED